MYMHIVTGAQQVDYIWCEQFETKRIVHYHLVCDVARGTNISNRLQEATIAQHPPHPPACMLPAVHDTRRVCELVMHQVCVSPVDSL